MSRFSDLYNPKEKVKVVEEPTPKPPVPSAPPAPMQKSEATPKK